ncbi:hypothetical protein [Mucilaginibacter sp.]|uniref:hypothetical protein n=1 Tax=Mucilaginibacter sp. TaxID=1882438 RepID=UPI0035BC2F1C
MGLGHGPALPSIFAIGQIYLAYRLGYFSKKGQNQADKEDIRELTRLVETAKKEFDNEKAKMLSDLDVLKDRKVKNYSQAQQALINFYTDYNTWVQELNKFRPVGFADDDIKKINKYHSSKAKIYYLSLPIIF